MLTAFEAGTQAESLLSFDSPLERHGILEIHGTEGSILLPDPNRFTGRTAYVKPLGVLRDGMSVDQPWIEVEERGTVVGRGLGVLDMVRAIASDRPHVASGELGHHVVDVLLSAQESAASEQFGKVASTVAAVPLLPDDFDPFASTL